MRIKSTGTRGKKLRESKQKKKVMRGTNAARIKCRVSTESGGELVGKQKKQQERKVAIFQKSMYLHCSMLIENKCIITPI